MFTTRQIVAGGLLLAIMIASMFLKNLSVYITGPIVNLVLIIGTLSLGPVVGIILSVLAPVLSFIITGGSPILRGIPLIIPCIMIGNILLCVGVHFLYVILKTNMILKLIVGGIVGSSAKAVFMSGVIVNCLLPIFSSNISVPTEKLPAVLATASTTFGITQLFTALIASALAVVIWPDLKKVIVNEMSEQDK